VVGKNGKHLYGGHAQNGQSNPNCYGKSLKNAGGWGYRQAPPSPANTEKLKIIENKFGSVEPSFYLCRNLVQ
jgi:hypothetical protein